MTLPPHFVETPPGCFWGPTPAPIPGVGNVVPVVRHGDPAILLSGSAFPSAARLTRDQAQQLLHHLELALSQLPEESSP